MFRLFGPALSQAPAGIKNHHAYQEGLLHHVVSLMELVDVVAPQYPQVDRDLVLMGVLLHDLSKIDELSSLGRKLYKHSTTSTAED